MQQLCEKRGVDPTTRPDPEIRKEIMRTTLPARRVAVRGALREVLDGLTFLVAEEYAKVELVLAEVLNNIVEHAYSGTKCEGLIELSFDISCTGLWVNILDRGAPMPWERLPEGRAPTLTNDISHLPEGGFGWFLIRALATKVEYARVGEENRLKFLLPLGEWRASGGI